MRDDAESAPFARAYACGSCKSETLVSDSSLTHVTNPFRLTSASICANCGPTPLKVLRWSDTGESVADFRRRMFRLTPAWVKVVQYLIIPGLLGVGAAAIIETKGEETTERMLMRAGLFVAGLLVANAIIWFTPLAGIAPAICGMKYHKYK